MGAGKIFKTSKLKPARSGAMASNQFALTYKTMYLNESLSPTLERGEPFYKGGNLYETITNKDGEEFKAIITYSMIDDDKFEYSYVVLGENHGIPKYFLDEIIEELIQKSL